ncbi:MAG: GntR family transcriptional regulator [Mycobacterium pseudokansasii]|uniref:GntR family transcriptional regulator n=1 Tax=Mycobacterium pseudokansasii TaxID=2341080 RepID=UPI0023F0E919|nr:GntR family transcriptional regulator [Mycobacterium pseudokansasii]MBY0386943.1 GntR family transcriptional regulator [Mycobacterium pseudokansasii]
MPELDDVELPLGEAAYRRLRADIVACRLSPGQRLTERGLASQLGMGVSPIRDALTRLDHEGLVRTIPRKGYQVMPLTIQSVNELFDFWAIVGPELVRRGVTGASSDQFDRARMLATKFSQLTRHTGADTRKLALDSVEAIGQFFDLLAEATGNRYLIAAHRQVTGEVQRVWTLVIESELVDFGRRVADLDDIGDAMSRRDADIAADLIRRHIERSHIRVLEVLARWPSVVTAEVVSN